MHRECNSEIARYLDVAWLHVEVQLDVRINADFIYQVEGADLFSLSAGTSRSVALCRCSGACARHSCVRRAQ